MNLLQKYNQLARQWIREPIDKELEASGESESTGTLELQSPAQLLHLPEADLDPHNRPKSISRFCDFTGI